jgi:hypothetical protein
MVKNSQFNNCPTKTYKDKNSYYYSFKTQLDRRFLGQSLSHWLRSRSWVGLTRVSIRIKVIIIIALKPDSNVDSGQDPGDKWSWPLT